MYEAWNIAPNQYRMDWRMPFIKRVIVEQFHLGLLYRHGVIQRRLEPGAHWVIGPATRVEVFDLREQILGIAGQEVLSRDNVGLKVSLSVRYAIADPEQTVARVANYGAHIYAAVQLALRAAVGGVDVDSLLGQRLDLRAQLKERAADELSEIGIRVIAVDIRDVMFPGELKKIFAEVVRAQKEGQAALERARGESAALRNLANAARVLESHPVLMNLRTLQAISEGEGRGNTYVLGLPQGLVSLGSAKGNTGA